MNINKQLISNQSRAYIIAELSGNHNGKIQNAINSIIAAKKTGADAIKLQTYTADTMTLPGAYIINDINSLWNGHGLYELYKIAYTPWEWHKPMVIGSMPSV